MSRGHIALLGRTRMNFAGDRHETGLKIGIQSCVECSIVLGLDVQGSQDLLINPAQNRQTLDFGLRP